MKIIEFANSVHVDLNEAAHNEPLFLDLHFCFLSLNSEDNKV